MKNKKRIYLIPIITVFLIISILSGFFVYRFYQSEISELKNPESIKYFYQTKDNKKITISINDLETIDDIITKLNSKGTLKGETALKMLAISKNYTDSNVYAGNYILEGKYSLNTLINILKIKTKSTIKVQIPENIRTINEMFLICEEILDLDSNSFNEYIQNSDTFLNGKFNKQNLPALFIPNTYELYTDITIKEFFNKMNNEYEKFWNDERLQKKDSLGLSKIEVSILASIIEQEQDKIIEERPIIAGLYINRLRKKHPHLGSGNLGKLQSDPTLIFALNDFSIKRVLREDKKIDSPFNTYMYKGLPPGPICIPSIHSIDAVLNAIDHNYFFMCAKEDFSGYHNFSCCYKKPHQLKTCNKKQDTHVENAYMYQKALDRRKVWR